MGFAGKKFGPVVTSNRTGTPVPPMRNAGPAVNATVANADAARSNAVMRMAARRKAAQA